MAKPFWGLYDGLDTGGSVLSVGTEASSQNNQEDKKRKLEVTTPLQMVPRSKRIALGPAPRALQQKKPAEPPQVARPKQPTVVKEEVCF